MVSFYFFGGQSFSKPPMPTHNRLFSESPTFEGTQHYLQSDVKVLHLQGSMVTFLGVVGKL